MSPYMMTIPTARRLTTLTMTMLALCGPLRAEDAVPVPEGAAPAASSAGQADGTAAKAAEQHYLQGMAEMEKLELPAAIKNLTMACDWQPGNPTYRAALERAKALAGLSRDPRSLQVERVSDDQSVRQQELWIDAQTRIQEGEKAFARQDYVEAERSFAMAQIRLENLPYADSRREAEMRRVGTLLDMVLSKRVEQERTEAATRSQMALDRQRELRSASLKIENDRVDALLRRAQKARERRDYDDAILLCENVLKINRAEIRAQGLLVRCRRERHVYLRQVTADRWDEEHRLLSENIRAAMLPQLEIVNYSPDWHIIDRTRSAPTQGLEGENEEWRKNMLNKLEQKVTVKLEDISLIEAVDYLRNITGVNIVLDPVVVAGAPAMVPLDVKEMQLKFVLDYIMRSTSLNYTMRDEAIFISNAAGMRGTLSMKLYDIRDLTHQLQGFPGPDLNLPEGETTGITIMPPVGKEREVATVNGFIDIIKKVVAPTQWEGAGAEGVSIEEYNGQMVVHQSSAIHSEIERLLRTLRNQQATQVHVKVKFLSVENTLLEEIGVNWQNFDVRNLPPYQVPGSPLLGPYGSLPGQTVNGDGQPTPFGAYHQQGSVIGAGLVNTGLGDYKIQNGLSNPTANDGMQFQTQYWNIANRAYISAVIRAVEKERRGNVLFEPDLTMFNGQQAHIVNLVQQAYISDYDVNQQQYMPIISTLSYGTVLDVQPIVSADKKYITMTVRPTNAELLEWRRFGRPDPNMTNFGGGQVTNVEPPTGATSGIITNNGGFLGGSSQSGINGGTTPLMIPVISYQAVRTSVTIPDGGSILLAGMNSSASKRAHTGVPFLSHIPFLGRLFSSNGRNEREFKTLIVLQADVVLYEEIEKKL